MKLWVFLIVFIVILSLIFVAFKIANNDDAKMVEANSLPKINLSYCNSLSNVSAKENCYIFVVRDERDSSICSEISDVRLRGDCYLLAGSKS